MLKDMQVLWVVTLIGFTAACQSTRGPVNTTEAVLSRRRRYVAFPEGSSVSVSLDYFFFFAFGRDPYFTRVSVKQAAICMTVGVVGSPNVGTLSWALNWGVAYNLPSYAWARKYAQGFSTDTKAQVQRRSRRDLYQKLELIMDK